jgi:pimeloyl-ACP methyl ester carboxylesterase
MYLSPVSFLVGWLGGLWSLSLPLYGLGVLWAWFAGELSGPMWLLSGANSLAWALCGRAVTLAFYRSSPETSKSSPYPSQKATIAGVDGDLSFETSGPSGAPALLLTHGWGSDASAWNSVRRHLDDRHRVILWDLPGQGWSAPKRDGTYGPTRLARDLEAVVQHSPEAPIILVGHGLSGPVLLEYCRLFPETLGSKVTGVVLANTACTRPLEVTRAPSTTAAMEPAIRNLLRLTVRVWPLVWLMGCLSYLNGYAHAVARLTVFGPGVTRQQLDAAAWFAVKNHPRTMAAGLLANLRWEALGSDFAVAVPTAVIAGGADRIARSSAVTALARRLRSAPVTVIEGAGHAGMIQQPQAYAAAIAAVSRAAREEDASCTPHPSGSR